MKNLKMLGAAVVLGLVVAMSAFAGKTSTPPCSPGEVSSPPCAFAQMSPSNSVAPGEVNSPPASNAADIYSLAEVALNVLQSVLSIF
jgi:hypothetical protein